MMRNRLPIIICSGVVVFIAIAICAIVSIRESQVKKALSAIDSIEYEYKNNISNLSDEDLLTRQNKTLEALSVYCTKKNVAGVRANMLAADIETYKKNYTVALDYWLSAAKIDEKSYTSTICYNSAAAVCEELNNIEDALMYYKKAAEDKDNLLITHVLFNIGRLNEQTGNYTEAESAYQKLADEHSYDSWTALAQSRLLQLRIEGKIE